MRKNARLNNNDIIQNQRLYIYSGIRQKIKDETPIVRRDITRNEKNGALLVLRAREV